MGWFFLFSVILLSRLGAQACTILELDGSGFANNAYSLLHALPMFYKRNGTFWLDNSKLNYRCSADGGWHDFFSGEENIVPWSRPKELVYGKDCARYTIQQIDELLYNVVQTKPDLLDFIGINMVSPSCTFISSMLPGTKAMQHRGLYINVMSK